MISQMNNTFFKLCLILLSFQLSQVSADHVRAAFDVGSGQTKITIALVEETTGRPIQVFFAEETPLLVGHDLKQSKDGNLSQKILSELEAVLTHYRNTAVNLGAKELSGVATAVFRESKNGADFISKIKAKTGISLRVISQEEEGRIGFLTAVAASGQDAGHVVAWDSGGASFQITAENGPGLVVYKGPWGASKVLAAMVEKVQGKDFTKVQTANPATIDDVIALKNIIQKSLKAPAPELQAKLNDPTFHVVAIGGPFSPFNMAAVALNRNDFTKAQIWGAIKTLVGSTDAQLGKFLEPEMLIPRLTLIYSVMDQFGIEKFHYFPTVGSTQGILISPQFWQ